jgi:hypothetical protein
VPNRKSRQSLDRPCKEDSCPGGMLVSERGRRQDSAMANDLQASERSAKTEGLFRRILVAT